MKKKLMLIFSVVLMSVLAKGQTWIPINICGATWCMINHNGKLFASGSQLSMCGTSSQNHIMKYDGASWDSTTNITNPWVNSFAEFNGELYAGGVFYLPGNVRATIIKLNGNNWIPIVLSPTNIVRSICAYNGDLYATESNGPLVTDTIRYISQLTGGTLTPILTSSWHKFWKMVSYNNDLYIVGEFHGIPNVNSNNIMKWDGTNFSSVGSGTPLSNSMIVDAYVFNGNLFVSGAFHNIGGISTNGIGKWDGIAWSSVGGGLIDIGYAIFHLNNNLIVGETFVNTSQVKISRIVEFNGVSWNPISFDFYSPVRSFENFNNELYAGGYFTGYQNYQSLMKTDISTDVGVNNNLESYKIFPNPFIRSLNITADNEEQTEIFIYDVSSRLLIKQGFKKSTLLNTEQLAKGLYLYEVRDKNGFCKNGKVVKD